MNSAQRRALRRDIVRSLLAALKENKDEVTAALIKELDFLRKENAALRRQVEQTEITEYEYLK